jgi:uncharacterized membrane protein
MNKHNDLQQRLAQRTLASLSLFIIVCVVVVTGIIAFLRPFSITVISLHVIFGLCFAVTAVWHVRNNFPSLRNYLVSGKAITCIVLACGLAAAIVLQIPPVRALMRLSANTDRTAVTVVTQADRLHFEYRLSDEAVRPRGKDAVGGVPFPSH